MRRKNVFFSCVPAYEQRAHIELWCEDALWSHFFLFILTISLKLFLMKRRFYRPYGEEFVW